MRKIDKVTYLEKPLYLKIDFDDDKNCKQLQGQLWNYLFPKLLSKLRGSTLMIAPFLTDDAVFVMLLWQYIYRSN